MGEDVGETHYAYGSPHGVANAPFADKIYHTERTGTWFHTWTAQEWHWSNEK